MLRITGGSFRGRMLRTPAKEGTRPTQSMLRQALFNSIQMSIPGARVLDLFAGSGALGFEALSRGAESVTFVDQAPAAIQCIRQNIETLGVQAQTQVRGEGIDRAAGTLLASGPFDIILADPPYGKGWEAKLLEQWDWEKLLVPEGVLCLEWGMEKASQKRTFKGKGTPEPETAGLPERYPFLVKIREKNYGESVLTTYQRVSP